jgi:hypothetical protein
MGPNDFKANYVCDVGATEEGQPTKTIKEEEKEKTIMFSPA